jgi:hypothetical protein
MAHERNPNQILKRQYDDTIAKLYDICPSEVSKMASAMGGAAFAPLKRRLSDRDDALDVVRTSVRTYGLLVEDLSRPGYLRFSHKSFMEYMIASIISAIIFKDDMERYGKIAQVTSINVSDASFSSQSMKFVGEIMRSRLHNDFLDRGNDAFVYEIFTVALGIPQCISKKLWRIRQIMYALAIIIGSDAGKFLEQIVMLSMVTTQITSKIFDYKLNNTIYYTIFAVFIVTTLLRNMCYRWFKERVALWEQICRYASIDFSSGIFIMTALKGRIYRLLRMGN